MGVEHLSDFVFISMVNITLAERDPYLAHVTSGVKLDTLCALTGSSQYHHLLFVFLASTLKKTEEDVAKYDNMGQSNSRTWEDLVQRRKRRYIYIFFLPALFFSESVRCRELMHL